MTPEQRMRRMQVATTRTVPKRAWWTTALRRPVVRAASHVAARRRRAATAGAGGIIVGATEPADAAATGVGANAPASRSNSVPTEKRRARDGVRSEAGC
jgi:hypothetical protein